MHHGSGIFESPERVYHTEHLSYGNKHGPTTESEKTHIREEDRYSQTLRLVIPYGPVNELTTTKSIDWPDPSEMDVWTGDHLPAFGFAKPDDRTVRNGDGENES